MFNEISPNATYLDNWHIDIICYELKQIIEGKNNRAIINIPPRYMKSIICSVALPAFILGHNPKATIIAVSYSDDLAEKFALDCRKIIESNWYQEIFPATKLSKKRKSVSDFETTKNGGRYSTSVQGTLTGRGADYIIIDDPIKPIDANSDTIRAKTNNWYGSTLYSRLNDKKNGKIIVIMQRLHENDFTGYLLNTDDSFKLIKIQGIAEKNEVWNMKDYFGNIKIITREKGVALHPQRDGINKLLEAKKTMGELVFAGQYQQSPRPLEGGVIKRRWLNFYNPKELFEQIKNGDIVIKNIIQSWDTANKIEEHNDYSVCITMLVDSDDKRYVVGCYREKLEFPFLEQKIRDKYEYIKEKYQKPVEILIEDRASGTQLIQTLQRKLNIIAIKPEHDKKTRLITASASIETGKVMFPNDNPPWYLDMEKELLIFPNGKHDDICDALSQALMHEKQYADISFNVTPIKKEWY